MAFLQLALLLGPEIFSGEFIPQADQVPIE